MSEPAFSQTIHPSKPPADWLVEHSPVTADASPEARSLLKYLYSITNHQTLTGQHNFAAEADASTRAMARISGKTPVIYGIDFGFAAANNHDSAFVRPLLVEQAIRQWQTGSIIGVTWHEVRPTDAEPCTFLDSIRGKLTDEQFAELLTPGSPLNRRWAAQVDEIVPYLRQLQAARVPLLFRPCHEMNGDWFWWAGRRGAAGSAALYRMMFERLVGVHRLTNLIWVWNVDRPLTAERQFVDFFPGQDVIDVLSLDNYGDFEQSYYDDLNALSDGKPLALAEVGVAPPPVLFATQPKWSWWMLWAHMADEPSQPTTRSVLPLAQIVADERMWSLEDVAFRESLETLNQTKSTNAASGAYKR